MSRGRSPRTGRPPPEGVRVDYPLLLITRAGRLTRIGGRNVLRLTKNPATEQLYDTVAHRLVA